MTGAPPILALHGSRRAFLLPIGLALACAAAGAVTLPRHPTGSWSVIALFSGCAMLLLRTALDRRPRLVLDALGITDRTLRCGRIDWRDILDATPMQIARQRFVALELRDPAVYLERLPRLRRLAARGNRALGFGELNLNLQGIAVDAVEFARLICERADRERATRAP
ncbi:MAG: STM3941 family protein [Planctomycetota bacterium]